ncbi:MAG: nucleoside triphosphate pyrophosphohydrolase [Verrucomicrobia bacterium]|nr:nucleoside triphosphate pyrophosphohydrolase [Verrucomicrobiota bacterium]MCH8527487.1 nucleoside triphosphate pyrophosphohydrolase [Kiritimatiellia bacterium]
MSEQLNRLLEIMETLRSETGCPWDREQTLETLRPYAVEEVYEVLDAIDRGDVADHCEELGDLLLQVVFQAQLRKEAGEFTFEDVARSISDKLVRRHPHVFGDVDVADSAEVLKNWNQIKEQEKSGRTVPPPSGMDRISKSLPALLKAHDLQKEAAKLGFDWPEIGPVLDKVEEEIAELRTALDAGDTAHAVEEYGDILFAMANVGRHLRVSGEQALQDSCTKFRRRFRGVEERAEASGKPMSEHTLAELDDYWNEVKRRERDA